MKKESTDLIDKIVRSKRRTIVLVITKDAALEVRVPLNVSLSAIRKFVAKNKAWIEKEKAFAKKQCVLPKRFIDGEEFIYEGSAYKLQISDCKDISISSILHFPKRFLPQAKQHLTVWYKIRALEKIVERCGYYANITRLKYSTIKLSSAESTWGSCGYKGSLNINWKLIMAPPSILDYIIVHELVHLVEKNHSKRFWDRVRTILPDYEEQESWLKQRGNTLVL
jgi:predicted metal-dependent hydrolase